MKQVISNKSQSFIVRSEINRVMERQQVANTSTGGSQLWSAFVVILEFFLVLSKMFVANIEAIYRMISPLPLKSVRGEVVLVTGAGHGIGKELALQYATLGATVVCWDVNGETNGRTVTEIGSMGFPKAYGFVCDVSDRESVLKAAKETKSAVGDVTIVVNNAGIMPARSLEDHTPEIIEKMFKINVLAHFWILEAFLPDMKRKNYGHIVALSSCAGLFGIANLVPYCGTKFAVRGYMEALHEELRLYNPNNQIKLTTIMPAITDTGLCKKPIIRFPSATPMLSPKLVAEEIIKAQRGDVLERTIPAYVNGLNTAMRLGPMKSAIYLKDFINCGVGSDL